MGKKKKQGIIKKSSPQETSVQQTYDLYLDCSPKLTNTENFLEFAESLIYTHTIPQLPSKPSSSNNENLIIRGLYEYRKTEAQNHKIMGGITVYIRVYLGDTSSKTIN